MDPNAALNKLRVSLDAYWKAEADSDEDAIVLDIIEAAEALDEWMSRGGFAPTDWTTENE